MNTLLNNEENIHRIFNTLAWSSADNRLTEGLGRSRVMSRKRESKIISIIFICTHNAKYTNTGICLTFLPKYITGQCGHIPHYLHWRSVILLGRQTARDEENQTCKFLGWPKIAGKTKVMASPTT